jgi:SAM-dependent methyltransferase
MSDALVQHVRMPVALEGGAFYDDREVFSTYMQHRAWSANPNETIEGPAFHQLVGEVRGKRVLDLGCGDGRFGRELLDAGALTYLGVDASTKMVELANHTLPGHVRQERIEEFTASPNSFDVVVSRLALHYVGDLGAVLERVYGALAGAGRLVFSVEHPVITSSDQAWQGRGPRQAWMVDDYFVTGRRETDWMGSRVVKFHRTVEDYIRLVQSAGFGLETLREPGPSSERFASQEEFRRRQRIPLFLLVSGKREPSASRAA